jgi:Tol biopolymer transport system component
MKYGIAATLVALLLASCFPVELHVSRDGRILIPREEGVFTIDARSGKVVNLYAPKAGVPVFARFAPDGKRILAVVQAGDKMPPSHKYNVVSPGGKAKTLFKGPSGTYARWCPDGKRIALTRVASDAVKPLEDEMPELHVVLLDGKDKRLARNVSASFRWFPDGKSILSFHVTSKDKKTDLFTGALVKVDAASGKMTPLAAVTGSRNVFFDLSADGKQVVFTANVAGAVGTKLKPREEASLFLLDVAAKSIRPLKAEAAYAIWSPDGKQLLLGVEGENSLKLQVADPALKKRTTVATDAAGEAGEGVRAYPAWVNNKTICYLTRRAAFGTAGKNIYLVTVGTDGKGRKMLQSQIDAAAWKSAK